MTKNRGAPDSFRDDDIAKPVDVDARCSLVRLWLYR